MDKEMTEDELIAALFAAQSTGESPKGALTTHALVKNEKVGRSRGWVCNKLRELIEEGKVECVMIQAKNIAGRVTKIPAYRLVDDESSGTTV